MSWKHYWNAVEWLRLTFSKFLFDLLERAAICAAIYIAAKRTDQWELWMLYYIATTTLTFWMIGFVFNHIPSRADLEGRLKGNHYAYGFFLTLAMLAAAALSMGMQYLTYKAVISLVG